MDTSYRCNYAVHTSGGDRFVNASTWNLKKQQNAASDRLSSRLRISPITAQLLVNREITDPERASTFIDPSMHDLRDPDAFESIDTAVERIREALREEENILIYGDYDVDGLTATSLLINFFELIDRDVDAYIPDRLDEGFGLNMDTVRHLVESRDPDLLITVDCGTSNLEEIEFLRSRDVDTIVLDHHEPPSEHPPARAILNPKLTEDGYPFRGLCAAGVSFKLAWGLAKTFSDRKKVEPQFREFLVDAMGFAALGTVADQVPLVDENRVFAHYGMRSLSQTGVPGLRALIKQVGLEDEEIDAEDIGYKIAPPLNAAGRLQRSDLGLKLFRVESMEEAREMTEELEAINKERRSLQSKVVREAEKQIDSLELDRQPVLLLADEDWHPGVIGVAASRIVDRYNRPTVLIGTGLDPARGSARSPDGFELHTAFEACSDLLVKHGGHANAAGLSIDADRIDAFRERLHEIARSGDVTGEDGTTARRVDVDLEMFLPNLDWKLLNEIKQLQPHGLGNPQPVFASVGVEVSEPPDLMGQDGSHLSFRVTQGGVERRAVGFGMGNQIDRLDRIDADDLALAYRPVINNWRGRQSIELHLVDIQDRNDLNLS